MPPHTPHDRIEIALTGALATATALMIAMILGPMLG
jgi:hypothetical protein